MRIKFERAKTDSEFFTEMSSFLDENTPGEGTAMISRLEGLNNYNECHFFLLQ
jgi:hypothetical protein